MSYAKDVALPVARRKIAEAVKTGTPASLQDALECACRAYPSKSRVKMLAELIRKYPVFRRIA